MAVENDLGGPAGGHGGLKEGDTGGDLVADHNVGSVAGEEDQVQGGVNHPHVGTQGIAVAEK